MVRLCVSPLTRALSSTLPCTQGQRPWLTYEDFCSYLPIEKNNQQTQKTARRFIKPASLIISWHTYHLEGLKQDHHTCVFPLTPALWKRHLSRSRWPWKSEVCRCLAAGPATVPQQMPPTTRHGCSTCAATGLASTHVFLTASYFTFFSIVCFLLLLVVFFHTLLLIHFSRAHCQRDHWLPTQVLLPMFWNENKQHNKKTHKLLKDSWGCRLKEKKTISDLGGRQWKPWTGHYFHRQKWDVPGFHVEAPSWGDNAISWSVC